jgi:dipeptidyl-peptidase-4
MGQSRLLGNRKNSTKGHRLRGVPTIGMLIGMLLTAALYPDSRPAQATEPATSSILRRERLFESPDLDGPRPRHPQLSPDGKWLALIRNRPDDKNRYDLWAIDTTTGAQHRVVDSAKVGPRRELSEAEKMQRERERIGATLGVASYVWAPDSQSLLVPLDGMLYQANVTTNDITAVAPNVAGVLNPTLSPSGAYVSFVKEGNLIVVNLQTHAERQLTDGASETVNWGVAEFVAQEEMDRFTGYWWAPRDRYIAVARVDDSPVNIVTRAAIGSTGTHTFNQRYPAAGTPNASVALYILTPDGRQKIPVDWGTDPDRYLARVTWSPDGEKLYVQRESRDQKRLDLLQVDPVTGHSQVLFSETSRTWINLSDNLRILKNGSILWWSQRDGYGHLYLWRQGTWTQLTRGPWEVDRVIGLDEKLGRVYFTGNRETPLEQHAYALDLANPRNAKRLTESGWWNTATMDEAAHRMIVTRSNTQQPSQVYLADATGKRVFWVEENSLGADHPYAPYRAHQARTAFGTVAAADGSLLYFKILTPPLLPAHRYPVFMIHYGGPGAGRQVTNHWGGALEQYLVSRGWVVYAIDNRGTPQRGKAFEDWLYHDLGDVEVADQMAGIAWLRSQSYVDPGQIVIDGGSYGGYLTLKMLEAHPGSFAAGIASAPVTKWELYDTHYTERYLGMPNDGTDSYAKADVVADAPRITDPLLLIHGMADDNVVLDNSTLFMSEMQEHARAFEVMLYPGATHGMGSPQAELHRWKTIEDFLSRHGVGPHTNEN